MLAAIIALVAVLSQVNALTQSFCSTQNTGSGFAEVYNQYQSNGACQVQCQDDNYYLAIVQGTECWCADYAPSTIVSVSLCNDTCPGYGYEDCGSVSRNLYGYIELEGYTPVTATTTTTQAVSSTTAAATSTARTTQASTVVVTSVNTVVSTQVSTLVISPSASDPVTVVETTTAKILTTIIATPTTSSSASSSTTTTTSTIPSTTSPTPTTTSTSTSSTSTQAAVVTTSVAPSTSASPTPVTSTQIVTESGAVVTQYITTTPSVAVSTAQAEGVKESSKSGLSNGAVAGITIGAVIAAALLGALIFLCCRRRRQDRDAEGGSGITRNTSVLSRVGLLRTGRVTTPASPQAVQPMSAMTETPTSPRNLVVDTRLNPNALTTHANASKTSVGTLHDEKDYSRPLEIRNPDVR